MPCVCWSALLPQDLRAWQPAKDSPSKVLRWQRTCLLSLLSLTQLHLQYPSSESAVSVAELLSIATSWMQDSIKAVCSQRQQSTDNSSSGLTGVYVQVSACAASSGWTCLRVARSCLAVQLCVQAGRCGCKHCASAASRRSGCLL